MREKPKLGVKGVKVFKPTGIPCMHYSRDTRDTSFHHAQLPRPYTSPP
jgi:hypothetical protein